MFIRQTLSLTGHHYRLLTTVYILIIKSLGHHFYRIQSSLLITALADNKFILSERYQL